MILVYQMAKVASMAWTFGVRAADPDSDPAHFHFLEPRNLQALADILALPKEENGLSNPLMATHMVRKGKQIAPAVSAAIERGEPLRIITGMRDPVARSLSLLAFFGDFCGRVGGGVSARDGATVDSICLYLERLWHDVVTGSAPAGGFDRLLWYMTGLYRSWFRDELQAVFGIDLMAQPFDRERSLQRMQDGAVSVLAYRVEDMSEAAPGHRALVDGAGAFLGAGVFLAPSINTAETRRSSPLYGRVKAGFRLPADLVHRIYDDTVVRHFYDDREIETFVARWARR